MKITESDQVTTIKFYSRTYTENAKLAAGIFVAFPAFVVSYGYFTGVFSREVFLGALTFFIIAAAVLLFIGFSQREIEIHPEMIHVKGMPLSPAYEFPVKDKMTLILENVPEIQFTFVPREVWRVCIGYEDGIYEIVSEIGDHVTIRRVVELISKKLGLMIVDYTYQDQTGLVMFHKPGETGMPFSTRATKYPDLLVVGEVKPEKMVATEQISPREMKYLWTPFSLEVIASVGLALGIFVLMIWIDLIGVSRDALLSLPWLGEKKLLYYAVILLFLAYLSYLSGIRNTLYLRTDRIQFIVKNLGLEIHRREIDTANVTEVRLKPSPKGFVLMITGLKKAMEIYAFPAKKSDFHILLWLTEKVQEFLLSNRDVQERHSKTPPEDGEEKQDGEPVEPEKNVAAKDADAVEPADDDLKKAEEKKEGDGKPVEDPADEGEQERGKTP